MSRQVLYVAAPLRPTEEEIAETVREVGCYRGEAAPVALRRNLDRAMRWLSWLRRSFPETTFIAPWICIVLSGDDDSDPAVRERAMQDNLAVVERCDGIVLCGGRISEGMRREMNWGLKRGLDDSCEPHIQTFKVYNLTGHDLDDEADLMRVAYRDGLTSKVQE